MLGMLAIQAVGAGSGAPDANRLLTAYAEAFNANDAAKLASLFAEDTILMPPDNAIIKGRAAVEAAYRARFAELRLGQLRMQTLDFDTHGDRATAVGTFSLSTGVVGDIAATGKYVVIYRRVHDAWLIAFQIVNYDQPQR
jgi:uncharacterized protein (TIGR02246 family)